MLTRFLAALPLLFLATAAHAAPDLQTSYSGPSNPGVYATARYNVTVYNGGNQNASSVNLTIQLPTVGSSPTNYIMGTLGARSAGCNVSGTTLVCALGTINKKAGKTVIYDIAFPFSAAALTMTASAPYAGDGNPSNNNASFTPSLAYVGVPLGAGTISNDHCTGQGLTSWFICTLFPSSISSHDVDFAADGTLTIAGEPDYTGTWSQSDATRLTFSYYYLGSLVATFNGRGVDANCFEGITTFNPPSSYNSGYLVCR